MFLPSTQSSTQASTCSNRKGEWRLLLVNAENLKQKEYQQGDVRIYEVLKNLKDCGSVSGGSDRGIGNDDEETFCSCLTCHYVLIV
jgi:hypothetical protein